MASPKGGNAIEPGIVQRLAAGVRFALSGKSATEFFGPGKALPPAAQEPAHGRAFDYDTNFNISTRPRGGEPIDFPTLRALADSYDLVRLAIETRKDQMGKLRWTVRRKDSGKQDATAKTIEEFLQEPDKEHDFLDWSRMLYEDLLVIDAPAVYIRPTLGGEVYAFEQIDGATITRKLDARGRTPAAPAEGEAFDPAVHTAYQQIIKGLPATDYHRDELIYRPRNPRVHKVYGYSPVEQIILIVNIGLRRQAHQLAFYTAGNIPEMLMATPKEWTPDAIAKFQKLWDQLMAGDLEARRQLKFVPGDVKPLPLRPESSLFDPFDEWLARVVSYCFNLPPNAFVKQQNRATAESAQAVALEEGLAPLMEWKARLMNQLIRKAWKTTDYEFAWVDEDAVDPKDQAEIDNIYVTAGIRLPGEVRADHNWPPNPELDARKLAPPTPPPGSVPPGDGKEPPPAKDDGAAQTEKMIAAVLAKIDALDARVSASGERAELERSFLASLAELRAEIQKQARPEQPAPSIAQLAEAVAKMADVGTPLNAALRALGFDITVPGGDVALVSATRIPLDMAGDSTSFAPPVEKVQKRAEPVPATIVVTPTVIPAPAVDFNPTINITMPAMPPAGATERTITLTRPNGDEVTARVLDTPKSE